MTFKVEAIKENIVILDFRIKNFCALVDTTEKVKRQLIEWEKLLVSHVSNEELVSRMYKLTLEQCSSWGHWLLTQLKIHIKLLTP